MRMLAHIDMPNDTLVYGWLSGHSTIEEAWSHAPKGYYLLSIIRAAGLTPPVDWMARTYGAYAARRLAGALRRASVAMMAPDSSAADCREYSARLGDLAAAMGAHVGALETADTESAVSLLDAFETDARAAVAVAARAESMHWRGGHSKSACGYAVGLGEAATRVAGHARRGSALPAESALRARIDTDSVLSVWPTPPPAVCALVAS